MLGRCDEALTPLSTTIAARHRRTHIDPYTVASSMHAGQLPLLLSGHNRRAEVMDELLDGNPDAIDSVDLKGNTLLHYNARYCNPEGAKRALEINPELAILKNFNEELPVHQAFEFIKRNDKKSRWRQLELLRIILDENPETVSQADLQGNLPLHLAVGFNAAYEVCEVLYNVYPSAALLTDGDGNLPVSYCAKDDKELQNLLFGTRNKPLQKMGLTSSFASFSVGLDEDKQLRVQLPPISDNGRIGEEDAEGKEARK